MTLRYLQNFILAFFIKKIFLSNNMFNGKRNITGRKYSFTNQHYKMFSLHLILGGELYYKKINFNTLKNNKQNKH